MRNCPQKKKIIYIYIYINPEQRAIASGAELVSKNASGWSSPKGFKNCFRNAPMNYGQTMPDDRFTLVKMNITSAVCAQVLEF